ncbi:hypothetical protein GCM10022217_31840 [Chryseobacterium ginsenosidimutans]
MTKVVKKATGKINNKLYGLNGSNKKLKKIENATHRHTQFFVQKRRNSQR